MGFKYNKVLVTGAAGFIGFHLSRRLLADGRDVTGIDNLNDYYDVTLKEKRLAMLQEDHGFSFVCARKDVSMWLSIWLHRPACAIP